MTTLPTRLLLCLAVCAAVPCVATAAPVYWAQWTEGEGGDDVTAKGVVMVGNTKVDVTYKGQIEFIQLHDGDGTDYWTEPDDKNRPYRSKLVDNAPPAPDLVAMSKASTRTLTFSQPVKDLLFAVVSLNGNGFRFNRDFDIVSYGQGYWGDGVLEKVTVKPGVYELHDAKGGEPHGVIRFKGTYSSFTWDSMEDENWYGFNVGTLGVPGKECTGPKTTGAGDPIDIKLGGDVVFEFNQTTLRPEAIKTLTDVANQLKQHPGQPVLVEGHTDNVGSEAYNKRLSQERAEVIANWLSEKGGVQAGCMKAVGLWYSRPVAKNDTDDGRQKNRRVEIHSDKAVH